MTMPSFDRGRAVRERAAGEPIATPIPGGILARLPPPGQRPNTRRAPGRAAESAQDHEYGFLAGTLIDPGMLRRAEDEAAERGVAVHEVLLASGIVRADDYTSVLAHSLKTPVASWTAAVELEASEDAAEEMDGDPGVAVRIAGRAYRLIGATSAPPAVLRRQVADLRRRGVPVALASPVRMRAVAELQTRRERLDTAVGKLLREQPASSAAAPAWTWQVIAAAVLAGVIAGSAIVLPDATLIAVSACVGLPFLCVTLLRLVALREVAAGPVAPAVTARRGPVEIDDSDLPTYSVLVPLFREPRVLPGLMRSLGALDYPRDKLEVMIVLEEDDVVTQAALLDLRLPGHFRTLLVPRAEPRTKPKALNYALQLATGEYVVVYDAEDRPEPDQLRRAAARFRGAPPALACVQARLNIYNPRASWFTRQFTIEYSALFDAILPALERLRLPVPLGGTSNHFPRALLIEIGGWDPYNVTEDADLGIRLARHGLFTAVLASTTWEEAPAAAGVWLRQRTRWLKGWMQTYLVHTRQLWRLHADLGVRAAIGFHALMGGLILSALVHPLFYALLAYYAWTGRLFAASDTAAGVAMLGVAWVNLAVGYAASILVGMLSVLRRGRPGLMLTALLMPAYWLLVSVAAYRALYQLIRAPFLWEKTEHGDA